MLQVESDGTICVTVNPIMSVFIILSSLSTSSTYFKSDLIFWARIARVASERVFLSIVENKSFFF